MNKYKVPDLRQEKLEEDARDIEAAIQADSCQLILESYPSEELAEAIIACEHGIEILEWLGNH